MARHVGRKARYIFLRVHSPVAVFGGGGGGGGVRIGNEPRYGHRGTKLST